MGIQLVFNIHNPGAYGLRCHVHTRNRLITHMVENLYEWSIGTKSPYKLKPYGQLV